MADSVIMQSGEIQVLFEAYRGESSTGARFVVGVTFVFDPVVVVEEGILGSGVGENEGRAMRTYCDAFPDAV